MYRLMDYKNTFCKKCINGNCIAKQEAPLDTFICEKGEKFELYEE